MKKIFLTSFLFVHFYINCQSFYYIEDNFTNTAGKKTFVTTLKVVNNNKSKILYYFNKRYMFNSFRHFGDFLVILDPFSNTIFRYSISKNKMVKHLITNYEGFFPEMLFNSDLNPNEFSLEAIRIPLDDSNIDGTNDTTYFYKFNILKNKSYLQGKFISNILLYNKTITTMPKFVLFDKSYLKNTTLLETLKIVDMSLNSIVCIDTIFFGNESSRKASDKWFNQKNVQVIEDSLIIYSVYNSRENYEGFNSFFTFNMITKKTTRIDLNEHRGVVGFFFDYKKNVVYINNSDEIYSHNLLTNKQTVLYKRDKQKTSPIAFLVR